ncbi:MAG TPA: TonB-dependent receptor [Draconibacterium sp.]|nr:TonB-dependent receptor [Draconibacterium sp.]
MFLQFFTVPLFAQKYQFSFSETPLSEALKEVSAKTQIKLSFDAGLLKQIPVSVNIKTNEIEAILDNLLLKSEYTFIKKYDTYLIVKKETAIASENSTVKYKMLSGLVYDNESGERLPYASIFDREHNVAAVTNVEGSFSIRVPVDTPVNLQVRYLGFQPTDTIISANESDDLLRIGLNQRLLSIETVDISGLQIEMLEAGKEAGHMVFNPSRFIDLPNYGETDIFRALQLLPGISSFENSSQLNVRGSTADQNLVLLDGFTLYNLDHFFGVFSALNPNVIKNIQVYRGGFDSRYGERVSAIVDIVGKSGNHSRPAVYGGINLISGNLTAEVPITQKLTVIAAGRRAYSDLYSSWLADKLLSDKLVQTRLPIPGAEVITPKFYFSDYNLKVSYEMSDQENLSVSAYGSKDNLNSSNNRSDDRGEVSVEDVNQWGNYGFGATWNKQWNKKYFTSLQLGHSGYFNDYNNNTVTISNNTLPPVDTAAVQNNGITDVTNESNKLTDYFLTFRNELAVAHKQKVEFGLSGRYNRFTYYKDATRAFVYDNLESSALLVTGFVQDRITIGNKLALKPGIRLNYYTNSAQFYIEPRFTGSYLLLKEWTIKFATGRYVQFLNKSGTLQSFGYNRSFWVLADGDVNPVVTSNHFIAGFCFEKNELYFDVEAYYKKVNGLQEYLFDKTPDSRNPAPPDENRYSRFISGGGKAMGIDFLAKYEGTHFTSWLAYSLSKSTRRFNEINNGAEIPGNFDQTHELKWTNLYNLKKWNFSTLAIYNTGKPYIESSMLSDDFTETRVYNRLPDYFRVDLSLNYTFNIKNVNIKPGLSLLNAFNTDNYLDAYTRDIPLGDVPQTITTLVKAQSLTLNFFVNFRF